MAKKVCEFFVQHFYVFLKNILISLYVRSYYKPRSLLRISRFKVILPFFLTASFRRLSARMIRFCSVLLFCVGVVYGVSLEML